jgi:hypothetical protein
MPTPHSYYPYLQVYDGNAGEKAHKGAFYIAKHGDTLVRIANKAYGAFANTVDGVYKINRNDWNIDAADANAFNYRALSTSCKSKIVDPEIAKTTKAYVKGGWLALCPPYPLFWIPEEHGQLPEDLAPPNAPQPPPRKKRTVRRPSSRTAPPPSRDMSKSRKTTKPGSGSPYYQAAGGGRGRQPGGVALAGFDPRLVGIGLLWLLGAGGYAWYRSRKKKKR